jgi:hypothetical protein
MVDKQLIKMNINLYKEITWLTRKLKTKSLIMGKLGTWANHLLNKIIKESDLRPKWALIMIKVNKQNS